MEYPAAEGHQVKSHSWVSIQYRPVSVDLEADGSLSVFESAEAEEIAEDAAVIGCWFCHTPLTTETFDTICVPEATPQNNADGTLTS